MVGVILMKQTKLPIKKNMKLNQQIITVSNQVNKMKINKQKRKHLRNNSKVNMKINKYKIKYLSSNNKFKANYNKLPNNKQKMNKMTK